MATVRLYAAAEEAAGTAEEQISAVSLVDLCAQLKQLHGEQFASILERCSVMVNGVRTSLPGETLAPNDTVDILPPFAGG